MGKGWASSARPQAWGRRQPWGEECAQGESTARELGWKMETHVGRNPGKSRHGNELDQGRGVRELSSRGSGQGKQWQKRRAGSGRRPENLGLEKGADGRRQQAGRQDGISREGGWARSMAARESELREASRSGCLSGKDKHARRKLARESCVVRR